MTTETIIAQAGADTVVIGAKSLLEMGVVGTVLAVFIGFTLVLGVLMAQQLKQCSTSTKASLDKNTEAMVSIREVLAELKGKFDR